MPLVPAFTATQASNLTDIVIVDTSTGSNGAIVDRHVFFNTISGGQLVPSGTTTPYVDFPIIFGIGDSMSYNILPKDYSLNIVVQWLDNTGAILYTTQQVFTSVGYSNNAAYGLIQSVSAQYSILNDTNYYANLSKLIVNINSATIAQTYGDQFASQAALDRAYELYTHQSLYF